MGFSNFELVVSGEPAEVVAENPYNYQWAVFDHRAGPHELQEEINQVVVVGLTQGRSVDQFVNFLDFLYLRFALSIQLCLNAHSIRLT